jgi:hypothetical protein
VQARRTALASHLLFRQKRAFENTFIDRTPIHVITTRAALRGAALYGLETLKRRRGAMPA